MARGISIHIGLNYVDPNHYEGWDGALNACVQDAKDMAAIAKKKKFGERTMLLNEDATAAAVLGKLQAAAKTLKKGDLLLLTYSGHGGQVTDTNSDEKDNDRRDETWVCFDRQLVDDELYAAFARFKSGVRIFVLSDSCHSGTVTREVPAFLEAGPKRRAMPRSVGIKVEAAHQKLYRQIQKDNEGAESVAPKASVILVSGCMDNQYSMDGDQNGAFTGMVKQVWSNGKFRGTYRRFRDQIVAQMPETQTPNYYVVGKPNSAFEAQKPFAI